MKLLKWLMISKTNKKTSEAITLKTLILKLGGKRKNENHKQNEFA